MNRERPIPGRANLLLGVGYFVLACVSGAISSVEGGIAAVWLANTFAIAFIASRQIAGPTAFVMVAAASAAANMLIGASATISLVLTAFNLMQIGIGLLLAYWWLGKHAKDPETPAQLVILFAVTGLAAPALTALPAALALDQAASWPILATAHEWTAGNLLGAAFVLPLLMLSGAQDPVGRSRVPRWTVSALTICGAAAVTYVAINYYTFPLFVIGLYLLFTTIFLTRFEIALVSAFSGAMVIGMAVMGLVPGFEQGIAAFADRFQYSLTLALVLPVFVSLLAWRMRHDRLRLTESEDLFRRAMEDSAIGIAIVELEGRIRKANRALAEMLDYPIEEIEGRTFFELTHPDDAGIGRETMKDVVAGRRTNYRFEKRYVRRDGSPIWAQLSGTVICDQETGRPLYLVSQIENIDDRKKAQQAVVEAENRWNFALSSARQGVWDLDRRKGRTYYSPVWKEMLGYADHELGDDPGLWLSLIHPDDREQAHELERAHLTGESEFFEAEFRMQHKDGSWIWVLDRGRTIERDSEGNTVRAIGTHTDITSQKRAQAHLAATAAALEAEKERLRVTLHSIGDAVICTDAFDNVTFMNAAGEKLTGFAARDAVGHPLGEVYRPHDEDTNEEISVIEAAAGGASRFHNRAVIMRPDGSRSSIRQVVSPIVTAGHIKNGTVIVFQDVTDARTLQRQLAYAASHDSLTGLANRANFLATMKTMLAEAQMGDAVQHQLLFVDLDRFKPVNDEAGHGAGDVLLKKIAATLRGAVRKSDFVGRLGGDEFALILRYCDLDQAVREAEKIIAAVSAIDFVWEGKHFKVGASVGIAPITGMCSAVDEIIANADKGCYAAKSAGRGTVSIHTPQAA